MAAMETCPRCGYELEVVTWEQPPLDCSPIILECRGVCDVCGAIVPLAPPVVLVTTPHPAPV